jgi:hypothetical protein
MAQPARRRPGVASATVTGRRCLLLSVCLLGATCVAHAQDGNKAASIAKQFAKTLQIGADKQPAPAIDPRLKSWIVAKLAQCYQTETGKPLDEQDRALLTDAASALVLEFHAAFTGTTCDPTKPVSPDCLEQLETIPCEPFAQAVHAAGWDRAPSPEMEAAIDKYALHLGDRYLSCQSGAGYDVEEAKVRSEYSAHSTSVQIAMLLTTGQCSLEMTQLNPCLYRIAAPDACKELAEYAKRSRLPRFCDEFLDCSAEPSLVGKVTK